MKLTDPIYSDEDKAREHLEKLQWPDGPICPHCGNSAQSRITKLEGKSTRPGVYKCKECRKPFSVTVGTLMERSHIPLTKWLAAMHLMVASKKGMSALQLQRMLDLKSYESAWFLCHRLREAMKPTKPGPIGGQGKIVEADETFIGGKAANRAYAKKPPKKMAVMALVERNGEVRSFYVANVTAKTLRPLIVKTASRQSYFMTDDMSTYLSVGSEFALHGTVTHSQNEYAKMAYGTSIHTNTVECFFSLAKRAVYGAHHSISEAHLHRYLTEWDFKFSNRTLSDAERVNKAWQGVAGRRLTYRRVDGTANA
jgi:transposase-like protein